MLISGKLGEGHMRTLHHFCNSSVSLKWLQNRKIKKVFGQYLLDAYIVVYCEAINLTRTGTVNILLSSQHSEVL